MSKKLYRIKRERFVHAIFTIILEIAKIENSGNC